MFKTTKAHALKECDPLVKGMFSVTHVLVVSVTLLIAFAECAAGRTVSVAWACREKFSAVQACVYQL